VAEAMEALRKPNMAMAPPTKLKIPKSAAPSELSTKRVVYRDINMVIPILAYKNPVFLMTLCATDMLLLALG